MVGKVTWGDDPAAERLPGTAILHDDGTWETPGDPLHAEALPYIYNERDWPTGPSHGQPGHAALNDLAARMGGTVEFEVKAPGPSDVVY